LKEVSDLTVFVYGHGLEIPIAERMARECKRVIYFSEWEEGFSIVQKAMLGRGMWNIERATSLWDVKKEVDLFMFPDIQNSGLQLELEGQGYPVWGSRRADRIETDREYFMAALASLGLRVPEHEVISGVSKLRAYLKERTDLYIKISWFRGTIETKHWRSWDLDANLIDLWSIRLGAVREIFPFLVFEPIDTPLEIGGDTYCVDGQWPSLMLHGIEWKDESYLSAVTPREKMPEPVKEVLAAFTPFFKACRMRNQWSMEIRVKDDEWTFIDPTPRLGLPSTASQLEAWTNFPAIVWAGAHGELVEPETDCKFTAELNLSVKEEDNVWPTIEAPDDRVAQWVKLSNCCRRGDVISFPTECVEPAHAGWLVAKGNTPSEVLETIKGYIDLLPDGLEVDSAPLAEVIMEIEKEQKEGIEFTPQPLPKPAEAL
jgi:hypothetical protein